MPIRVRHFLKTALRSYGLRCAGMDGGDGQEFELLEYQDPRRELATKIVRLGDMIKHKAS